MTALANTYRWLIVLGLLSVVPMAALGIIRLSEPEIRKDALTNLTSIAELKAHQVEEWLAERQVDLEFLATDEEFVRHVEHLLKTGDIKSQAHTSIWHCRCLTDYRQCCCSTSIPTNICFP